MPTKFSQFNAGNQIQAGDILVGLRNGQDTQFSTLEPLVFAATTVNLTATYNNGTNGVGATLTNSGTMAAFLVDGINPPLGSRILVKNQTAALQNGIYTITTVGSASVNWVLTRSIDYDTVAQIYQGSTFIVLNGFTNDNTQWIEVANVTAIGTSPIVFAPFNTGMSATIVGTPGQIDVVTAANVSTISIDPGYIGQTSITTLGTVTTGTWNAGIISPAFGGTGINNGSNTITIGGNVAFSGAFPFVGTLTGSTSVVFPVSGTLATTSSASGIVNSGLINELTYYASSGTTVSGLETADNGVLITSGTGVPSISSTLPTAVQDNITAVGALAAGSLAAGFTPVTVPLGGTGNTTFTAYSVICAGTTATGTFQNVTGVGLSGQVLTSQGASALPIWANAAGTGTVNSGTANDLAYYTTSTNAVSPLASANNGVLVTSASGVPSISAATTPGQMMQANASGTPAWSSLIWPLTAIGDQLLTTGNGVTIGPLTTTNRAVVVSSFSGVLLWSSSMTNGQLIIGNTSGTPTAANLTAGAGINVTNGASSITLSSAVPFQNMQAFTTSGTFTTGSNTTSVYVKVWGGGGGGAGSSSGAAAGSGGAGGGYSEGFVACAPSTAYTITVGAGGAAGTSQASGGAGGTSSAAFITTIQATGGQPGTPGGSASSPGTGSNGTLNLTGMAGGAGGTPTTTNIGGYGGDAPLSGGAGRSMGIGNSGFAASDIGGGGSGAGYDVTATKTGGAGAPGLVLVYYY